MTILYQIQFQEESISRDLDNNVNDSWGQVKDVNGVVHEVFGSELHVADSLENISKTFANHELYGIVMIGSFSVLSAKDANA